MTGPKVLGHVPPLSQIDFRERLSGPIGDLCELHGRGEIARVLGCDGETVSNARSERTSLNAAATFNLLLLDPAALNPILKHYGLTAAPIDGGDDEDDAAFAEIVDGALEIVNEAMRRGRLGRLCHQGKAAVLRLADKLASKRLRVRWRA